MRWWIRFSLVAAVGLGLFGWRPAAQAQNAGPEYVVQAGDTLYDIALHFGLTVEALQAANPTIDPAALAVGQTLIIPGFAGVAGNLVTHVVEPGETLDSLALRYGMKRETLVQLNHFVNPERLYISEALVLVDRPDAGAALPVGTAARVPTGLLTVALAHGISPWALAEANRLTIPVAAGPHTLVVVPGGERPTRALSEPLVEVAVQPVPPAQGRTLSVQVTTSRPLSLTGMLGAWPLNFEIDPATPEVQHALVGIYRLAEPNLYPFSLSVVDAAGQTGPVLDQMLPVRASDFGADPNLTVDPATLDPVVIAAELEQIRAVVSVATPTRYWTDLFVYPSVGSIRSRFGSLRAYNGGAYDSFHGGVDFSGGEDRPITAPAPGVVAFTGLLTVRGNTTIIDHGWGVYTLYAHQSAILVTAGQPVTTGDLLGYQGATGRVTGPHLHWEIWVAGNQVNPLDWTESQYP